MLFPKDKIISKKEYYSLTLYGSKDGKTHLGGQTAWVGFADAENRIELREFSTVKPVVMAQFWIDFNMPFCVVNDSNDFAKWYISGGHALVAENVAKSLIPESLKPGPCVQVGRGPFIGIEFLPESVFKKAPTPKKRLEILKRDSYRCKICGRRPDDHVDIELHVHHIKPFGSGGVTHEENLITLCSTCHKGLDPHYEWSLYGLLRSDQGEDIKTREAQNYIREVQSYRATIKRILQDLPRG